MESNQEHNRDLKKLGERIRRGEEVNFDEKAHLDLC